MQLPFGFCTFYRAVSIDSQLRVFSGWSKRVATVFALLRWNELQFRFSITITIAKLLLLVATVVCKHLATVKTLLRSNPLLFTSPRQSLPSFLQKYKTLLFSHVRSCRRSIFRLLLPCSPHAIFRKVTKVIVDSLQGMPLRAIAHVSDKTFKAIQPSFAYCYSTGTVSVKRSVLRIAASLLHALPYFVKWMTIHSVNCFSHFVLQSLHNIQYLTPGQRIGVQCKKG